MTKRKNSDVSVDNGNDMELVDRETALDAAMAAGPVEIESPKKAKAKKAADDRPIKLHVPEPVVKVMDIQIHGISPLIVRAWDQKTEDMLAQKAQGINVATNREDVVPEDVYNAARYVSTDGWDGMPASAFKAALVDAVTCGDIPKTQFSMSLAKKTFFVHANGICEKSGRDLIRVYGVPEMMKQMQRTKARTPYMSYRPIYREWYATIRIEYNAVRIDAQGVLNLMGWAGHWVGVGEHRPSSPESKTGTNGRWELMAPEDDFMKKIGALGGKSKTQNKKSSKPADLSVDD